jgi:hypothetical protein
LSLNGHIPQGNVEFHLGFKADSWLDNRRLAHDISWVAFVAHQPA